MAEFDQGSPNAAHAIRAARLQVAFDGQPALFALGILLATVTLVVLWPNARPINAVAWYLVFIAVAALRIWVYRKHRGITATAAPVTLEKLQRQFVSTCWAAGASWGLACVLIFPEVPILKMFVAFVLAGVSAAAVTSLSAIRSAAIGFVAAITLPLAVRLLTTLSPIDIAMSIDETGLGTR